MALKIAADLLRVKSDVVLASMCQNQIKALSMSAVCCRPILNAAASTSTGVLTKDQLC